MPPRGVKKGTKRERQYEAVKKSVKSRGASTGRAEEIAARTVNKERARSGESRRPRAARRRTSPPAAAAACARGRAARAGAPASSSTTRPRSLGVEGRSKMNKAQLQRAVDNKKR